MPSLAPAAGDPLDNRLDPNEFRDGLRRRGLIELLEFQLSEAPVGDEVEADLLRREVLLAAWADRTRSAEERAAALSQANDVLRALIANHAGDERAWQWRLDLGRSLLHEEADPYCVRVLYRGGNAADRRALENLMTEALETFDALLALLVVEYDRLDNLKLAEYERLERRGYIEQVEQIEPQAVYMRRWASFYRALARDDDDPGRLDELRAIVDELRQQTDLLTTPHDVSHAQAQSLLLSGMAARRIGDHQLASQQLAETAAIVERVSHPIEQRDLHWVATLARLERARTLRDARRYDEAIKAADDFRAWVDQTDPDNFGFQLVAADLEGSVARAQSRRAAAAGDAARARSLADQALVPLMALADRSDACRDAVYADLYGTIGPDADLAGLHPFERCALVAGLLAEAAALELQAAALDGSGAAHAHVRQRTLLDRAIAAAQESLAQPNLSDGRLRAELLYNLGAACYRRGARPEAIRAFLTAARDFPDFRWAESAAQLAVQAAAELAQDPSLSANPDIRALYLEAIELLVSRYPQTPAANYWQFFYAQALEGEKRFDDAARQYARVASAHEHYVQARFGHARCLAASVGEKAGSEKGDRADVAKRAVEAVAAAGQFASDVTAGSLPGEAAELQRLGAAAAVLQAEVCVLPGVDRLQQALDTLEGFEQEYARATDLIGRVLRARIIAYEGLGRLDQAAQEIPRYIESDPQHAAATLQALFEATRSEVDKLRELGREQAAQRKTQSALLLAEQIHAWAANPSTTVSDAERSALKLQLAEACAAAGQLERAHSLFNELLPEAEHRPREAASVRAVVGLADTLFALQRYAEALPHYNGLYSRIERSTPIWWRALLGDLACRTELGQPPADVIRAIKQHRFLYPGQPEDKQLQRRLEALLQRNRQRLEAGG